MSDNKRITLDGVEYELVPIKEAVKRWRARQGASYFYLTRSDFDIETSREDGDWIDDRRYNTGNYFASKAEASHASRDIQRLLRGEAKLVKDDNHG